MTDRAPAELTARRVLIVGVAASIAVSVVVALAVADPTGRIVVPPWHAGLTFSAFVVLMLTGAVARWARASVLRVGSAVGVALFLAALLLFAPASGLVGATPPVGVLPWSLTAIGGVVMAAVVAGGHRVGWAVVGVWLVLVVVYRIGLGGYNLTGLANDSQALVTASAVCLLGARLLEVGRDVDAAAAQAQIAGAAESSARGQLAARARAAAFVHDEVLAALRGAADGAPGSAEALRRQADRATRIVDADRATGTGEADLEAIAREYAAEVQVDRGAAAVTADAAAVDVLARAMRQALDNSRKHAGLSRLSVRIVSDETHMRVEVADDGVGFDPARPTPGRLGTRTSIVGAMAALPGGRAEVRSASGVGTTVTLTWHPVDATSEEELPTHPTAPLFGGLGAIGALFLATQSVVAAVAVAVTTASAAWVPVVALAGLLAAAAILRLRPRTDLSVRRAAAGSAVVVGAALVALAGTTQALTYGTAWFVPAAGLVLAVIALRGRPAIAGGAFVVLVAVFVTVAVLRDAAPVQFVSVAVRTVIIVGFALLFAVTVARMQRAIRIYALRALRATRRRSWDDAARRELETHAHEIDLLAGDTLVRLAAGEALDAEERAHAGAIEGRLRDRYRAGRLVRDPLTNAAMAARIRCVDVVLLDDAGTTAIDDGDVAAVVERMRDMLDGAQATFVGRMLPGGRAHAAQVVVDGRAIAIDLDQGAGMSFPGE
ncbi:ATP-binding protein [Microbacterium sp. NPDC089189]|uniref:sensor histidine kinase n=1 Tax=Microbacterium sp. NPDC089189 TaxID=3154972 RepID=UPI003424C4E0